MQFIIFCQTFRRLARLPETLVQGDRFPNYLRSVFLERKGGHVFAVSTNGRFAAMEYLGEQPGVDGSVAISIAPEILQQCDLETQFNSSLMINYSEEHRSAGVTTTYGFAYPYSAALFAEDENQFLTWRNWLPKSLPTASKGSAYFNADHMNALVATAPGGQIVLPSKIDATQPVIVQDPTDENWLGVFISRRDTGMMIEPATLPVWLDI